jgi:colicin import membrane protein
VKETLERAEREHETIESAIEAERGLLKKRSQAEDARREKQMRKLDLAVRRAGE